MKNTTRKKSSTKKPQKHTAEPNWKQIEQWAVDAVQSGEQKQQFALIALLNAIESAPTITDMSGIALTAKYAAFRECESLLDEGIESVLVCGGAI